MTNKHLLIVEDDPTIRRAFSNLFTNAGYRVQAVASAEEALQVMRQAPVPVLFLDLKLPGMNGLELCREVRKEWPWSIAIAVTGYATLFELVACREVGFDDYFIKPVGRKVLLLAAENAFKKLRRWKHREQEEGSGS